MGAPKRGESKTDPCRKFCWSEILHERNLARFDPNAPHAFLEKYVSDSGWTDAEVSDMNKNIAGVVDDITEGMRSELRLDLPDHFFEKFKANNNSRHSKIKAKKNTTDKYQSWCSITNLYYYWAHRNSGSHGECPSLKSEFIDSKPGKVQFTRLAEIISAIKCHNGTFYAKGSVKSYVGILFKAMRIYSKEKVKLMDDPMCRAAVKLLFINSKAKGNPKLTQAIPTAYMDAVAEELRKKEGLQGLIWRCWYAVHRYGALRANSEDWQLLWGDFKEVTENGSNRIYCNSTMNAKRGDPDTELQDKRFVLNSPWCDDLSELKHKIQNQSSPPLTTEAINKLHVFLKYDKLTELFDLEDFMKLGSLGSKMWKDILVYCHAQPEFRQKLVDAGLDPDFMNTGAHRIRATVCTGLIKQFGEAAVKTLSNHASGSSLNHYVCNDFESLGKMADAIALQTSSSSKSGPKRQVTYPSSPGNNRTLAQIGELHATITEANSSSDPDWSATQPDKFESASLNEEDVVREFERRKHDPNEYYFDLDEKTPTETEEEDVGGDDEVTYDADSEFEGISEQLSIVSIKEKRKRSDSDLVARYPKRSNKGKRD